MRQIVENLCEITAGFALQHDSGHKKFYIHQWHTFRKVQERITHRHTIFLFFVELAKFAGGRICKFVANDLKGHGEGVPSPDGTGQRVYRFRKGGFEFLEAATPPPCHI